MTYKRACSGPTSLSLSFVLLSCLGCCVSHAQAIRAVTAPTSAAQPVPASSIVYPFSKVVVLGDSLSAGFQNGSLVETQQPNGWASLIARQAGFNLTLPLIAAPGFPAVYDLVQLGIPPVVQQEAGVSTGRANPNAQVTDLAVPGHTLSMLLHTAPVAQPATENELMTNLVLGSSAGTTGTQLQQAIAQQPSLIYLWIGGDDALPAISAELS